MVEQVPQQKQVAGATLAEQKGKIVEYAWWLKKKGYREYTILRSSQRLTTLVKRGANLLNPESVKEVISQQPWAESTKATVVAIYTVFLKMLGRTWEKPIYKPVEKFPFIPTEKEIDDLIAGSGKKLSAFLQLLKETGMRSGEADKLKWIDVDFEHNIARVTPEKNSKPRIFRLSTKCVAMLNALPKTSARVFGNSTPESVRKNLQHARKRLAHKLSNPRLLQIHFHTLRHWKATTLYHQTKDILYVKEFMGHRKIDSTLLYVQLEKTLFQADADSFTCRVAQKTGEVKQLIEAGFDYVTQKDGLIYFRKRK